MFTDLAVFVEELLPNELNSAEREFDGERLLINGFEETRTKFTVDADRRCDDALIRLSIS